MCAPTMQALGALLCAVVVAGCARTQLPPPVSPAARVGEVAGSAPSFAADHPASTTVPVPGGCSTVRTTAPDAVGCYMMGSEQFGTAPATPLFWHIDAFASRDEADRARGAHGTVAQAHGRVWLLTITDSAWRPSGGERIAQVGPLPVVPGRRYAAHYLEGVVPAGARTPVHQHAGPEAWFVLEGSQCLETPDGARVVHAGETLIVREGRPMLLVGVGLSVRRTLALVFHDEARAWTLPAPDWTPKNACPS